MMKSLLRSRRLFVALFTVALLCVVTIAQRTELRRPVTASLVRTSGTPGAGANDIYKFNPNVTAGGNWKEHLDWAISDNGAPDCPDLYIVPSVWRAAIASARAGDYATAFRLALVSECHNAGAQMDLAIAGQQAVCEYLRAK